MMFVTFSRIVIFNGLRCNGMSGRPILLISDDVKVFDMLRVACMDMEIDIIHARDTYEGMRLARKLNPLVTFIDAAHTLSHNGWVTTKIMKNDKVLRNIPVLVFSDAENAKEYAHKALCDRHLPRQFPIREVRFYVKNQINLLAG
jgi:DNA-binding response OmpR family regulator